MATPASSTVPTPLPAARIRAARTTLPPLLAILLGLLIIGVSGFSHQGVIHNAAHDARHSSGFPCH
jgi:cobalt transporter subunit CbtB